MLSCAPLGPDDLDQVAHITVATGQVKFSGSVAEAFESAEAGVDFHAILGNDVYVGFFKIDTYYPRTHTFAPTGSIGLRGFMIDVAYQGRGIASRTTSYLPVYLSAHYAAPALYLTVNIANPAAVRAYLEGGMVDTGEVLTKGIAGPQHVMRLPLT